MNIEPAKPQTALQTALLNRAKTDSSISSKPEKQENRIETQVDKANTSKTLQTVAGALKNELQTIDQKDKGLAGRLTGTKTSRIVNTLKEAIQLLTKPAAEINEKDIRTAKKWLSTNFEIGNTKGNPEKQTKHQLGTTAKKLLKKVSTHLENKRAEYKKTQAPHNATHQQVSIEPTHETLPATQPKSPEEINARLTEDYNSLKTTGTDQSKAVGGKQVGKNRYRDILPYDNNRVKVSDGKNYINASRVLKKYIASQGPTENTTPDHLTMLFEQKSPVTVMLTNPVEKGRVKCHQYWTPGEFKNSAGKDVKVELSSEEPHDNHIERKLRITIGGKTHEVTQLHYTAWPDHGVPSPENTNNFNKFVDRFNKLENPKTPSVIHCSAGVGRTGTFIAVDQLNKTTTKQPAEVSLKEITIKMRMDRMLTIQTEAQYRFAYQAQQARTTPQEPQNPTITTTKPQMLFGEEYANGKQDIVQILPDTYQYNQETHTLITKDNKEIPIPKEYELNTTTGEFKEAPSSPQITMEPTHATLKEIQALRNGRI